MKKTSAAVVFALAAVFAGAAFFSCDTFSDLAIPETVSVKSNARYAGALGQRYYDLSEKLGDSFVKDLEKNAGGDVYKYIPDPNDQTLAYLLHKKLYDVPLNVSEYLDSMKLSDEIGKDFKFEKTISLPKLQSSVTAPIAAGLVSSAPAVPVSFDIDFALDDSILEATIGAGSIAVVAEGSGAQLNIDSLTITGLKIGGASTFTDGDFAPGSGSGSYIINKTLDLSGAVLDVSTLKTAKKIQVTASLSVASGTTPSTTVKCSVSATSLSSAKADLSSFGAFEMSEASANKKQLPKEMVMYVKDMSFEATPGTCYKSDKDGNPTTTKGQGKGIKFKCVNSFPAGNDIALEIKSQTFGIDSTSHNVFVNGALGPAQIPSKGNDTAFDAEFSEYGTVTVEGNTTDFGTSASPAYIKFSIKLSNNQAFANLELGKNYKIGVSDAQMLFDWDCANILLSSAPAVDDSVDLKDFSIDSMMSEIDGELKTLVDNCEFATLPVYFFVNKPAGALAPVIGASLALEGKIFLTYTDSSSAAQKDYIAGGDSSVDALDICDAVEWPASGQTCSKVFATKGTDFSLDYDFKNCLNARPKDLKVNYSMGIKDGSDCALYKALFDTLSSSDSTTIAVEMAAHIPIALTVAKSTDLDIFKLAEMDMDDKTDMMDRDSVSDTTTYAKYSGAISYLNLNCNFVNSAVSGLKATVTVDDRHAGEANADDYSGLVKTLEIDGDKPGDCVFEFKDDEIKAVLTHFFLPKMTMTVPIGTITVKRSAIESPSAVGINPTVVLQLNDAVPVEITDIIK